MSNQNTSPNIKKVLLISKGFTEPAELREFLKTLGYLSLRHVCINSGTDYEIFNERIIEFVESRSRKFHNYEHIYFGAESIEYRIGFSGLIHVTEVDISKSWTVVYTNTDIPIIKYVDYEVVYNKYNKVYCIRKEETECEEK